MQPGLGRGLPTRPRWLSALLFSLRQPSLVMMGGASLYSVWSAENLIIQANCGSPFFLRIYSQKISSRPVPTVAEPLNAQLFRDAPVMSEGETIRQSNGETRITALSSDHRRITPVRKTSARRTLFICVFIRGREMN